MKPHLRQCAVQANPAKSGAAFVKIKYLSLINNLNFIIMEKKI